MLPVDSGRVWLGVLAIVVGVPACKESAKERATRAVSGGNFWPEAPKPTKPEGPRAFAYKPENLTGFTLVGDGGTPAGSEANLDFKMTMNIALAPGKTPRERDASIENLDMTMNVMSQKIVMRLDRDEMFVEQNGDPVHLKRGEDGPLDVAGMTDKPFTTFRFSDANEVRLQAIEGHPLNELGGTGDMLDNALLLFPDLPQGPVSVGHKWTVKRKTPVGGTNAFVDVTYDYEYAGDSACPSGKPACSLFTFSAASSDVDVTSEGIAMRASYGFAGKVFFDHERGGVDESRVRMDLDATAKQQGVKLKIAATFVIKPKP